MIIVDRIPIITATATTMITVVRIKIKNQYLI